MDSMPAAPQPPPQAPPQAPPPPEDAFRVAGAEDEFEHDSLVAGVEDEFELKTGRTVQDEFDHDQERRLEREKRMMKPHVPATLPPSPKNPYSEEEMHATTSSSSAEEEVPETFKINQDHLMCLCEKFFTLGAHHQEKTTMVADETYEDFMTDYMFAADKKKKKKLRWINTFQGQKR